MPVKYSVRTAAVLAVAALTAPAAAAARDGAVIPVTVTSSGFCAAGPDPRPPGPVTYQVSTPDASGHWLQLMSLRGDTTMDQVNQEFTDSYSSDPSVAIPALRAIYRDVDFRGGTSVQVSGPVSVTSVLQPGTYYLSDTALTGATEGCGTGLTHLERFQVAGDWQPFPLPPVNTHVEFALTPDGQRIDAPSTLPAKAMMRVQNLTEQPNELIIIGLVPGTTDSDVQAYFDAVRQGQNPPSPFLATAGGMLAISPGRSAIFQIGLRPGTYCMASFVADPANGVKAAYEGMHHTFQVP